MGARVAASVTALVSAVLVWQVWRYFVATEQGQHLDQAALRGSDYGRGTLWAVAEPVLDVVSVSFVVLGLGIAMGIALLRRRWGLAVQVAFVVVGSNITTQFLKKAVLDRPDLIGGWGVGNTLPSGHTTVAASVAVALLLAVPRAARPAVAVLGGTYTVATGVSTLVGHWHRPSDVVAAVLVVTAWAALALALTPSSALDELPAGRGSGYPGSVVLAVLMILGGAAAALGAAWCLREVHPASWDMTDVAETTAYVGGALGVVAVTSVSFAVLLLLRQATSRPARLVHGPSTPRAVHSG
ncbi:phosphatase PAP2 family protein [Oerskovia sp. Sa1BUA8]|uniref:Phosphatase PAP2 family protein n=1 Tax=Oerskovia douganii TaxID=2762210 RepID=A0A9D5YX25_9CELL|nr:phosphatase PAP2 family protein [Oerskovia douganii]